MPCRTVYLLYLRQVEGNSLGNLQGVQVLAVNSKALTCSYLQECNDTFWKKVSCNQLKDVQSVKPSLKFNEGQPEHVSHKMHAFNAALLTALESVIEEEEESIDNCSEVNESVNGVTTRSHSSQLTTSASLATYNSVHYRSLSQQKEKAISITKLSNSNSSKSQLDPQVLRLHTVEEENK